MNNIIPDLGYDINNLPKKTWDQMGKPKMVWSPIQLGLANQYKIYSIRILEEVGVNIDSVKSKVDMKVIEIMDDIEPYLNLLGICFNMGDYIGYQQYS